MSIQVGGSTYTLEPAAEKAGFVVYVCGPGPDGGVPPYPVRRKIERQAARVTYEHMVIFIDSQRTMQVWQWVKREGGSFIDGIAVQGDKEWYASLMLNRMMFVYFIQKQGFLDGDPDYLRNRLRLVQERTGKGRFQQFYRLFLRRLFHEGLGYIYPAVGHGVTWDARQSRTTGATRLELPYDLPEEIAASVGDVAKRGDWNRPAPEEFALPTETWREAVARRQRHQEVRAKLVSDAVQDVNDLITLA